MVTEAGRQIARDVAAGRPANPDVRVTVALLTDSSTGTAIDTVDPMVAGGTGTASGGWDTAGNRDTSITAINDNFASLSAKINALLTNLKDRGVID